MNVHMTECNWAGEDKSAVFGNFELKVLSGTEKNMENLVGDYYLFINTMI